MQSIGERIVDYICAARLIARVDVLQDDGQTFRSDQDKIFVWSANAADQITEMVEREIEARAEAK